MYCLFHDTFIQQLVFLLRYYTVYSLLILSCIRLASGCTFNISTGDMLLNLLVVTKLSLQTPFVYNIFTVTYLHWTFSWKKIPVVSNTLTTFVWVGHHQQGKEKFFFDITMFYSYQCGLSDIFVIIFERRFGSQVTHSSPTMRRSFHSTS